MIRLGSKAVVKTRAGAGIQVLVIEVAEERYKVLPLAGGRSWWAGQEDFISVESYPGTLFASPTGQGVERARHGEIRFIEFFSYDLAKADGEQAAPRFWWYALHTHWGFSPRFDNLGEAKEWAIAHQDDWTVWPGRIEAKPERGRLLWALNSIA